MTLENLRLKSKSQIKSQIKSPQATRANDERNSPSKRSAPDDDERVHQRLQVQQVQQDDEQLQQQERQGQQTNQVIKMSASEIWTSGKSLF